MAEHPYPDALPTLTRLHWYVLERVLGQGGFGITYLAKDSNLDQRVAIKEYLPVEFATRLPDATVRSRSEELRDRYRWGLERFIQEARTLARFDHPNIVRVLSVFEFNNTAYIVMRFEEGGTLAAMLDRRGTLSEADLLRILLQVLDGLELVHSAGFIHRDIKPDNIHIGGDGRPVLLDFGSARQAVGSSNTLTILIAPGYAPFEQYYNDPSSQGPWTDIYGLGATAYRAICGRAPLDAVSRSKGILGSTQEIMVPASVVGAGRYSSRVLAAIDHALAFAEKDRPQTISEWRNELAGEGVAPVTTPPALARARSVGQPAPPTVLAGVTASPDSAVVPKPLTQGVSPASLNATEPARRPGSPWPRKWMFILVAIAVTAVAVFAVMKVAELERQIQEQSAGRTPKQQPDDSARQPRAPEQAPREDKKQEPEIQPPGTLAANPQPKPRDEPSSKPSPKPAPPLQKEPKPPVPPPSGPLTRQMPPPVSIPPNDGTSTKGTQPPWPSQKETTSLPSPSPQDATPPSEPKAPAPRMPADQLADADKAFSEGRHADAIKVWRPLADAGNTTAQLRLGVAYAEGIGVERDSAAAQVWYEKSANGGNTRAMLKLEEMFANGKEVNNNLAYIWCGIAAQLGSNAAKVECDRVGSSLQPAQRRQADKVIASKVEEMTQRAKKP